MPIDPKLAAGFPLLEGITTFEQVMNDPDLRAKFDVHFVGDASSAPPCDVSAATVPGPHGPVPVRVYQPLKGAAGARPGLVWMHGGGFVSGDLDMPESDLVARELCDRAGAVVVTVDYRLSVDGTHFPIPHDDVMAAFRWAAGAAGELGVDPARLAIGGGSAGGNLAAGAALHLRDDADTVQPSVLLLAYPVLHHHLPAPDADLEAAMAAVPTALRFPTEVTDFLNRSYLGDAIDDPPAYAMPAVGDPKGLPPAVIVVSEYDDLRPSGEAWARQLGDAGVPVQLVVEAGVLHGHLNHDRSLAGAEHTLATFADALVRPPAAATDGR